MSLPDEPEGHEKEEAMADEAEMDCGERERWEKDMERWEKDMERWEQAMAAYQAVRESAPAEQGAVDVR